MAIMMLFSNTTTATWGPPPPSSSSTIGSGAETGSDGGASTMAQSEHDSDSDTRNLLWSAFIAVGSTLLSAWVMVHLFLFFYTRRWQRRRRVQHEATVNTRAEIRKSRELLVKTWLLEYVVLPHAQACGHANSNGPELLARNNVASYDEEVASFATSSSTSNPKAPSTTSRQRSSVSNKKRALLPTLPSSQLRARDCPICFEPFSVNDTVTWSSHSKCRHVFHFACLQEWLVQSTDCPFCRQTFLAQDDRDGFDAAQAQRIHDAWRSNYRYCVEHGVVAVAPQHHPIVQSPTSGSCSDVAATISITSDSVGATANLSDSAAATTDDEDTA